MKPTHTPHMLVVSQVVRDVKVGGGSRREDLAREVGRLRTALRDKAYIPGDKLNANFLPQQLGADGVLKVEVFGGMLEGSDLYNKDKLDPHFFPKLPLDLRGEQPLLSDVSHMQLQDILSPDHCNDVSIDDGGNAQNMTVNACLAGMSALREKFKLTVLSSSDPFKRMPDHLRQALSDRCTFVPLPDIPDRIAIQVPWSNPNGERGTFALTTEPADMTVVLEKIIRERRELQAAFRDANCFVASDPSFQEFRKSGQPGKYCIVVNAATKWRSQIAGMAFGSDVILPMNHKEAGDVAHVIQHVGAEEEMHKIKPTPFPSPLKDNGTEVHPEKLAQLDDALWKLSKYNHPHHRPNGLVAFNYPITFEERGGLVVGTRNGRSLVAFTSTVDESSEWRLIDEFGDQSEVHRGEIETMGAGDSAATIIALFNSIDPHEFFEEYLEGREKTNALLHHYAQTIFTSAMSRIVGNFLIHTKRCHWSDISLNKFQNLFQAVAKESLEAARNLNRDSEEPSIVEMKKWGIHVVTWPLGAVSHPDTGGNE